MKSQIKRFSKSTLSVVLAICMLVSCMTVGLIATDAAYDDSEALGASATIYYAIDPYEKGNNNVKLNSNSYYDSSDHWNNVEGLSTGYYYNGYQIFSSSGHTYNYGGFTEFEFHYQGRSGSNEWANKYTPFSSWTTDWDKLYIIKGNESGEKLSTNYSGTTKGWNSSANYYLKNNFTATWSTGNPKMKTDSGDSTKKYYDFYGKKADFNADSNQFRFRFYGDSDRISSDIVPSSTATDASTASNNVNRSNDDYVDNYWKYDIGTPMSSSTAYYRLRTTFDVDANNGKGSVIAAASVVPDMAPTFSTTAFTKGETYNLTSLVGVSSNSNIGTVNYSSYQYYDGSWHDISSPSSWTPSATNITKIRVTATDGGIITTNGETKNAKNARSETKETSVTVTAPANPTCSAVSLSRNPSSGTIYEGITSVTYTASATSPLSGVTYNFKVNGTSVQNTSSNTYTKTFENEGNYEVTVSVEKANYDTVSSTANSITVSALPTVYMDVATVSSNWSGDQNKGGEMTYDSAATTTVGGDSMIFKLTVNNLSAKSTYYLGTWDGTKNYKPSSSITSEIPLTGGGVSATEGTGTTPMTTKASGTYCFYYDYVKHKYYVEYPAKEYYLLGFGNGSDYWGTESNREVPARKMTYNSSTGKYTFTYSLVQQTYPYSNNDGFKVYCNDGTWFSHNGSGDNMTRANAGPWTMSTATGKGNIGVVADVAGEYIFEFDPTGPNIKIYYPNTVSFDTHGGSAVNSQVVTYGGNATRPATDPTRTGYTFTNWYTAQTGGSVFNFANTAITQATPVHAQWSQNSYNITYNEDSAKYTIGGTKPSSAHYQDTVNFTVTAEQGYRIDSVSYNDGSSHTINPSNGVYSFTMPATNVIISVATVKTYTVTLIAGEGIDSKQYRKGTSGNYTDYSQTITVDTGSTVQLKVSYSTGYEYDSSNSSLDGATTNNNLTFTLSNITSDKSVTIAAKKKDYDLTGVTSPENHGTITFYKDNNGSRTNETIETANYQQYFWAVYTPADGYQLKDFSIGGGGASRISASGNSARFKMGSAAATVTATVILQYSVTYYVDMHKNTVSSLSISITDSNGTVLKNANNQNCTATLTKVNSKTTVYSAAMNTPLTQSGSGYSALNIRITYNGKNYNKSLASNQVSDLVEMSTKEVWLEAVNESSQPLNIQYSTIFSPESGSTPAVPTGYRRIYLAKPKGWEDSEPNWKNIKVYHWGNYNDMGWNNGVSMNHLGYGRMPGAADEDTAQYHFYYVDLPKYVNQDRTLNTDGTGNKVQNIIFQGWADNATSPSVQTGNIEKIPDSADFFILSKDGNSYEGTKSDEDVVIPTYARHASFVKMNVGETTTVNITPVYTGAKIVYSSSDTTKVTVNETTGVINPVSSTINESGTDVPVTITVKVYGSIGAKISDTANGGGDPHNGADAVIYTVSVSVHNTSKFNGFNIMAIESQTYTVSVPQIGSDQPGYFDMTRNGSVITVTGLLGVDSSIDSAIINPITDNPTSFTVKYAKANNTFSGYSDIEIIGTIVTKSNHNTTTGKRYGLKQWKLSDDSDPNYTISRKVANGTGIETATTTGVIFSSASATYRAIFEEYQYVDVTFTFNYDEYKPKKVDADGNVVSDNADGMIQYPYDATWADENNTNGNYSNSHNTKTFVVQDYEVRYRPENGETFAVNLRNAAAIALGVEPNNNYYDYNIPDTVTATTPSNYKAASTINLIQSVKQYKVFVNGVQIKDSDNNPLTFTYQQYAEPTVKNACNWYAVDSSDQNASIENAPLLATNVNSYKFRVKGSANSNNTYLRTVGSTTTPHGNDFLRSEVDFSHYEVTHQGSDSENMKEYLMQNFYIADFFSPAEVLDPKSYTGKGKIGEAYKVEKSESSASPSSGNITVYFTDTLNWNNIKIYYWGENIDVQWPGNAMMQYGTDEDGKTVYSASISENVEGIIFTGNEKQTVDITKDIANGSHWKSINETAQNGIPYDDAQFVGGGVVYYSMNGVTENSQGTPFANAVSSGYVGNDGEINANAIKEMLKSNIEAYYSEDVSGALGEEEAMKIAYGTEIAATKNVEGGFNTGIIYRYLPLNQYKRDGSGNLETDGDGKYTLAYDVNNNTFRYSNSLQSYQYVYASGNENKATNAGKNMRLYSYYVYSYVTYDQETNVPVTKYEIVLSDNYSDASTYWEGNPNPDPSN